MQVLQSPDFVKFAFSNEEIVTLYKELVVYAPYQDTNGLGDTFLEILKKLVMKVEITNPNGKC